MYSLFENVEISIHLFKNSDLSIFDKQKSLKARVLKQTSLVLVLVLVGFHTFLAL